MRTPVNFYKRKFYNNYFNSSIEDLLKYLQVEEGYALGDLLWLVHAYVRNMNDDEQGIARLEKYLITQRPKLSAEDMGHLMAVYQLKGRINKTIYELFVKPYMLRHKMANMEDLIDCVKFTICSESEDAGLLKNLYELVSSRYGS
jgi:hypothetical protein